MLKFKINERYLGYHYVWCSPVFEASAVGRGTLGADQPGSSDPATIYRRLHDDVSRRDRHANEVDRQRASVKSTALYLAAEGRISDGVAAEIAEIASAADLFDFRPVLYAIPYEPVSDRVQLVQVEKRASIEPEYVIADLKQGEFQMIEPYPCR